MIHRLSVLDERSHKFIQGSSFFRSEIDTLSAFMFYLLIGRIRIFSPIEVLVVSAGMIRASIADIGRSGKLLTEEWNKIGTMLCAVTGFTAFAQIIAKFAIAYPGTLEEERRAQLFLRL